MDSQGSLRVGVFVNELVLDKEFQKRKKYGFVLSSSLKNSLALMFNPGARTLPQGR